MNVEWKKICCPIDFSEPSRAAMRTAVGLCERFGAKLTLLHAYQLPGYTLPEGSIVASPKMMQDLADKNKVASVQELLELAKDMGVKLWPCQMTMDLMGLKPGDMIDGLDKPAGAGAAISLMKQAKISLFI